MQDDNRAVGDIGEVTGNGRAIKAADATSFDVKRQFATVRKSFKASLNTSPDPIDPLCTSDDVNKSSPHSEHDKN
jgi:hypothetical protein